MRIGRNETHDKFVSVVEKTMEEQGVNYVQLADKTGYRSNTLYKMPNFEPKIGRVKAICDALGLEFYIGPPRNTAPTAPSITYDGGDFTPIPLYNVTASAGRGRGNEPEEMMAVLPFPNKWLRRNNIRAANARLIYVDGDSMAPTIKDKAMVMVRGLDDWRARLSPKQIFAFTHGGELFIKRLQMPQPDTLIATSDNHDYPPMVFTRADMAQIRVIGEVVWTGHGVG